MIIIRPRNEDSVEFSRWLLGLLGLRELIDSRDACWRSGLCCDISAARNYKVLHPAHSQRGFGHCWVVLAWWGSADDDDGDYDGVSEG